MSAAGDATKRATRPKQLKKLDVAFERERSVKARQSRAESGVGADARDASAAPKSAFSGGGDGENERPSTTDARGKSPTKQQRNTATKVAVDTSSSDPVKRPASAPVKPAANSLRPGPRFSVGGQPPRTISVNSPKQQHPEAWQPGGGADDEARGSKTIKVRSRKTAIDNAEPAGSDASDEDAATDRNDNEQEEDAPARGHYDIFIQTRKCEDLCLGLGLTLKQIRQMKKLYDANDMYCTGEITQAEFFFMINEEERPISKGIFTFGGIAPDQKFISFDQYALCAVQFASLTKPELFQFVFDLYDDDQSGSLDEREFAKMSKELQSKQFCFPKNVATAVKMLGGGGDGVRAVGADDGLVDIAQFMKFARNFPVAFYPIVNMQKNIRAATLGESLWSRVVARKMKVQDMLTHMRRNSGAIPEMTTRERLSSFFSDDVFHIRKRAGELYAMELRQRRYVGSAD